MQITIEDLESLKELNDELEENHIETEKALQEDLGNDCPDSFCRHTCLHTYTDAKDAEIRENLRKIEGLEEACLDLEGTITQFRELVLQLQS